MIAPRMQHGLPAPETEKDRLERVIRAFARPARNGIGLWRSFETEADALEAVIAEVDETVLPRQLRITARETGAHATLTVANRRLVAVEGLEAVDKDGFADAAVAALAQVLGGCRTVKADLLDRNPKLPRSARSCAASALRDAIGRSATQVTFRSSYEDLKAALRAMSVAWLDADPEAGKGGMEPGSEHHCLLSACLENRPKPNRGRADIHPAGPTLSILPAKRDRIVVLLESRAMQTGVLCDKGRRDDVLAAWRAYCADAKLELARQPG